MMRNTSPVGWVPLLFFKIIKEGAFVPFLLSGIFIALPLILSIIYLDSLFYQHAFTGCSKDMAQNEQIKDF